MYCTPQIHQVSLTALSSLQSFEDVYLFESQTSRFFVSKEKAICFHLQIRKIYKQRI